MNLKSLCLKTDLLFIKFDGEVIDHQNYLVAQCFANPNFFWGNLIVFKNAPQSGDLKNWKKLFKEHFTDPRIYHETFTWDQETLGDIKEFLDDGYKLEKNTILTARKSNMREPSKINDQINIKIISSKKDWQSVVDVQVAATNDYADFYPKQALLYQKMIDQNMGHWFGAFIGEKLVASLGIFKEGKIGRFQIVSTHPDFGRQGICSNLVYRASLYAFEKMEIEELVMVADEDYYAAKIYERVGFIPTEKMYGLCKWQKNI